MVGLWIESKGFVEILNVERNGGVKNDSNALGPRNWNKKMELPYTEIWKTEEEISLKQKIRNLVTSCG